MLELINVTKQFENVTAVDDVSFQLENGKVLGIIGRNGAGKSTIFRMILGLMECTSGKILYNGEGITQETLNKFGYLPEEGSLPLHCSVIDACEYYGALKQMDKSKLDEELFFWLKEFHLEDFFNTKLKKLSKGNRQKIQFIVSVLHDPEFLILDEPFSGLDPVSVKELEEQVLKLKAKGKTIIFSSHIMPHVEKICDQIILLEKGKDVLNGNLEEIISHYRLEKKEDISLNDIFITKVGEQIESC